MWAGTRTRSAVTTNKALAIDPRHMRAWFNKGNALKALARHEEAIGCYDKALAIGPRDTRAWNNKGSALCELRLSADREAVSALSIGTFCELEPAHWREAGR